MLWVEFDEQLECDTSGGPVIDESGKLIGIISNYNWLLAEICTEFPTR